MTIYCPDREMIAKIEKGDIAEFKALLINQKVTKLSFGNYYLNLLVNFLNQFIIHLGQALQGTQVSKLAIIFKEGQYVTLLAQTIKDTAINNLNVKHNDIEEYAPQFARVLKNTKVHKLNLVCTEVAEYAPQLIQALTGSQVNHIKLRYNKISETAPALIQALQTTWITKLDLSYNFIGKYAALLQGLQNTRLTDLSLAYNFIGENAIQLAQALQHTSITKLNLANNNLAGHSRLFAQALKNTHIEHLNLSNNHIGDYAFELMQGLIGTSVKYLNLHRNDIKKDMLAFAQALQHTQIIDLDLSENYYLYEDFPSFAQSLEGTKLKTLNLSHVNIKDTAELAQSLKGASITALNLAHNKISDVPEFIESCKDLQLTSLSLAHNQVKTEGLKLVQALRGTQLKMLNINSSNIHYEAENFVLQLFHALQNSPLHTLGIDGEKVQEIESLIAALANTSIKCIKVYKSCYTSNENAEKLEQAVLANCKQNYIRHAALAEQQGAILKELYQNAHLHNPPPFPIAVAKKIAHFLDCAQNACIFKRFFDVLQSDKHTPPHFVLPLFNTPNFDKLAIQDNDQEISSPHHKRRKLSL